MTIIQEPFEAALSKSIADSKLDFWDKLYSKLFPAFIQRDRVTNYDLQQEGVDSIIWLKSHNYNTIYNVAIEEKLRETNYSDLLLEYVSNTSISKPGWIEKSQSSKYLMYVNQDSKYYYSFLFNMKNLQKAWITNKNSWLQKYGVRESVNKTYNSLNCPVDFSDSNLPTIRKAFIAK
jgi:hypothetical protein